MPWGKQSLCSQLCLETEGSTSCGKPFPNGMAPNGYSPGIWELLLWGSAGQRGALAGTQSAVWDLGMGRERRTGWNAGSHQPLAVLSWGCTSRIPGVVTGSRQALPLSIPADPGSNSGSGTAGLALEEPWKRSSDPVAQLALPWPLLGRGEQRRPRKSLPLLG